MRLLSMSCSLYPGWVFCLLFPCRSTMFKMTILRMMLLLWMTRVTLQGGTGYGLGPNSNSANMKGNGYGNGNGYRAPFYGGYSNLMGTHPQKGAGLGFGTGSAAAKGHGSNPGGYTNGGASKTQSKQGYGGYPNGGAANQPNTGYPNGGSKGPKPGYGGYPNGGAANQPNTCSSLQNMGYPNGGTKGPKAGYGAKAGPSNGQGAKHNGYGGYPNVGAANQPNTGSSLQNMGYPNGGTKGPKPGYGAKAGPSNGQGAKHNGYGGYPNGGSANQPNSGYGAKAGPSNGQGAKPNGYGPSNGQGAKPNGYGGYPNGGAANQPNTGSSLQNMGYPNGGNKGPKLGYGAKAGPSNGQGAKPNGYGGYPNGGAANQPNTGSFLQNMGYPNGGTKGPKPGYGAKAGPSNGQGAKPNGYGGYPNGGEANQPNTGSSLQNMSNPNGGTKGPKAGYGAKAGPSNGQGAKPNGYPNGGSANQPNTGSSLQNMGYPNGGTKGPKPGYGAKAGPLNGQGAKHNGYGGYRNGGAANQPNTGSFLQNMGYPNGGTKGPKAGYGAKAGPPNGQGAKPNRYGGYRNAGAANQPNTGSFLQNMGYPNGGTKGPKAGYPNGGAANQPNTGYFLQNMGYPNGGTKGPKAGYGAKAGPSNGQGAKSNGYGGYPNGGAANQPNTGYGAKAGPPNGQGAKPNGYGVPGYMSKGPYKAANSGYMPVTTGKEGVSSGKGPKGEILSPEEPSHLPVTSNTKGFLPLSGREPNTGFIPEQTKELPPVLQQIKGQNLHPQGKAPNSMAPQPSPKPFMQGPGSYKPSKAYKPPAPVIPQSKAPKPAAPVVPQAILAPESAPIPQDYYSQTSQTVALEQEQNISPVAPQPIMPHASISSQAPLVPESARSTPEMQQTKIQSNQALNQMKNPTTNHEFTGLGQPNGQVQGAIPSKPDCGPGGQPNGQWVKLPSLGSGYPNGKGAVSSQPGFGAGMGGYPAHGMNNGYKAGYGGYGNQFKKQAGPQGEQPTGFKGKSQAKYGIGGLPFGGSPNGYQTNPSGQYGNDGQHYGAKPYNPKASGKYGHGNLPYNSQPFLPESVAKSPSKYDFGGLPYNGQPLGYGHKGLQYGGHPLDLRPDAVSGKYGESSPESLYNPETLSLGADAKSAKYGNPAVSYELLGPVTDGQSVDENRSLEALHQGPEIDGQKSIDQYGDGEVPPHPDAPGAGEANAQSIEKYGTGDYTHERVQPEVVSFAGVPTVGPVPHLPAVTSLDTALSLDGSSPVPVSVPDASTVPEVPVSPIIPQPELPTLMLQPAPPQQIHIQQHLKFHIQPNGDSHTGKEGQYKLSGFFGNKYQG